MRPQDTLGYWLSYAFRHFVQSFAATLRAHCIERGKPYVVTPPQWGVMEALDGTSGLSMGALGERIGIDAAALTATVKRLELSGLVERVHDRQDRRLVLVALTDEGKDIIQSLVPVVLAFNDRVLPADQRQVFFDYLQYLVARVSEVAPDKQGLGKQFLEELRNSYDPRE